MDDAVAKSAESLYESDFHAWTREQAALLRHGQFEHADIAKIVEEIDTLGRKEVAELRSRLKVLSLHLLKEIFQPEKASRSWAATIVHQRQEIAFHLQDNPSLTSKISDVFVQAYMAARSLAAVETGLSSDVFPREPPFTYTQALDTTYWPGHRVDDDVDERKA